MKSYEVRITAYVETAIIVDAESKEQACSLAEEEWSSQFIVYNPDLKEYSNFSDIIGYEPKEID